MSINFKRSLFTGCVILLGWASSALGQKVYGEYEYPFDTHEYHDFQPFAPAQLSEYGNGPKANEGYFFNYDRTLWAITPPDVAQIGAEPEAGLTALFDQSDFVNFVFVPTASTNDMDTGWIEGDFDYGHRFEGGYVVDNAGWLISGYDGPTQVQRNELLAVGVLFDVVPGAFDAFIPPGPLGALNQVILRFDEFQMENETTVQGVEINRLYRWEPFHNGGVLEWFFGPRIMEVDDKLTFRFTLEDFFLLADDTGRLEQKVDNQIVGPQIGTRYHRRTGRLTMSAEGRLFAGVNFFSIHQEGYFAPDDTAFFFGPEVQDLLFRGFKNSHSDVNFSPMAEIRFDMAYQLTKAISIRGGYTGMFTTGITRASNTIEYTAPGMGIRDPGEYGESLMVNGFNVGIEINR